MERLSLIFDLDGTLWDTTKTTYKSVNFITKKYNLEEIKMETIRSAMGQTKEHNAKLFFPNVDLKLGLKLLDEAGSKNIEFIERGEAVIYPDIENVLNELSEKMDLYIVSNSANSNYISMIKKYIKCEFKDTLAAGSIGMNKSNGIRYIIEKNKINNAIYIGDTELDKISAEEAGITFIYAEYGFGDVKDYKYTIKNIKELESVIKKIY